MIAWLVGETFVDNNDTINLYVILIRYARADRTIWVQRLKDSFANLERNGENSISIEY